MIKKKMRLLFSYTRERVIQLIFELKYFNYFGVRRDKWADESFEISTNLNGPIICRTEEKPLPKKERILKNNKSYGRSNIKIHY